MRLGKETDGLGKGNGFVGAIGEGDGVAVGIFQFDSSG